jgi:hypothetical protein
LNPYATRFLRSQKGAPWHDEQTLALEGQVHQLLVGFFANLRGDRVLRADSPELLAALVLGAFDGMFEAGRQGQLLLTDQTIAAAERAV